MGRSSRQARHRKCHHTEYGTTRRALKYVTAELKRMRLHNGEQGALRGFRVHPEFGWCDRALQHMGFRLASRRSGQWRKQRDVVPLSLDELLHLAWVHCPNKGLFPVR